jgi:hypothetical protein
MLVDPITLPCGHNTCRVCFKSQWLPKGNAWAWPKCGLCKTNFPLDIPGANKGLQKVLERHLARDEVADKKALEVEFDEELTCPSGYKRGNKVFSKIERTAATGKLAKGDEGVVLGPAFSENGEKLRDSLVCCFPNAKAEVVKCDQIYKALPEGYRIDQEVVCLIDCKWTGANEGKKVSRGDIGKVLGPGAHDNQLKCSFPGNTNTAMALDQIWPKDKPVAGGYLIGEAVKSLVQGPQWKPRPLTIGAEGVILCPAPEPYDITVGFGGDLVGNMRANEVCRSENTHFRGGLKVGDRVKSLIEARNWTPRPLTIGAEGVILCSAPRPHDIKVVFDGDLVGSMKSNEVCKSEDYAEAADAKDAKVADAKDAEAADSKDEKTALKSALKGELKSALLASMQTPEVQQMMQDPESTCPETMSEPRRFSRRVPTPRRALESTSRVGLV